MAIITISREMGTGAYKIAQDVAKQLKYTLVDGPMIRANAHSYGITEEMLQLVDEKPPAYITVEDRKRAAILNNIELILLDFARKGNVVLYGRGGQDILAGCNSLLRLRFIADFEQRVELFSEREWIDPDMAHSMIRRSDHQRGGFIHFYFDRNWNDPLGYDMIFNTSRLSKTAIIDSIIAATKDQNLKNTDKKSTIQIDNIILVKKIETALLNSSDVNYSPFKITADKGNIHLSGYISSDKDKKATLKIVEGVKGVKSTCNDIQVVDFKTYKDKH